uniref:Cytochrome b6-f complex subunit 6 n=4 Tax=Sphagnum TaxID=13804 RepID=A0A172N3T1_9BRYO|nr:cytochrome b6/f complex subunit VI [Sphagnum junghuhnianum]AND46908.1 subunit VI of cytochrome b6/f complex [Sphagnum girgensohnii]AND47735.1 subunit VI of cytochrome b6/f complex [Sphagnum rubiginosum]AND47901.1 subunit VI of cytochrome b6/f complex [Sphagnum aongstroemii]AND49635.1 subunit VI of cytochrome b6/f complex [Sphagnum subnitens]UIG87247.1 cytochrome b6/f complex subunit VI [Sphagnum junghuhnianum]
MLTTISYFVLLIAAPISALVLFIGLNKIQLI